MIALAVVAAQYAGTFDAAISARGDGRINDPPAGVTVGNKQEQVVAAADASFSAAAFLHVRDRHWDFSLGYAPSFLVPDLELQVDRDVQEAITPTFLNAASASVRWHDRFSWFSLTQSGAYGTLSTTVPYTGAPTTATPQQQQTPGTMTPQPGMTPGMTTMTPGMTTMQNQTAQQATLFTSSKLVHYAASSTGAAVGTTFGRHTTATLSGGYAFSGGIDADTTIVPYLAGPTGLLSIATQVSPSESVFTTANGNYTYMDGVCPLDILRPADRSPAFAVNPPLTELACTTQSDVFQLVEGYRRQTSLFSSVAATVGAAAVRGQGLDGVDDLGIVPVLSLAYVQDLYTLWPGTLNVTLSIAPTVDLLTSIVSDAATAVAVLNARVTKLVTVAFTLTGTQSLPIPSNDSPFTGISGAVEGHFRLNRQTDVLAGAQLYWQYQVYGGADAVPPVPSTSLTTVTPIAYVGVTLHAPTLHF